MSLSVKPQKNEYIIKLKRPHRKQEGFVCDVVKRKVVRAGRRGGKTTGTGILAVKEFLKGKRVLYAAPTVDQVGRFWTEVTTALADPIERGIIKKNESTHTLEIPGTEIRIKAKTAWNADSLRGDYADVLILDEWQLMNEDAWELVGVPMLLDNNGDAIFIYTPPSLQSRSVTKARDPRHASKLFKKAQKDTTGRWKTYHFTSHDNPHLSRMALEEITLDMSKLSYRMEINAEDVDEAPGALWHISWLDRDRVTEVPEMERIVIAVDPSGNKGESGLDDCGIGAMGRGFNQEGYFLEDATTKGTPKVWATKTVDLFRKWKADAIIAEKNFGGEMVRTVIHSIDSNVPVRLVSASRGKTIRAEPISVLSENRRIHLAGDHPKLEDELTMWVQGNASPNRLDMFVWGFTELFPTQARLEMFGGGGKNGEPGTKEINGQVIDSGIAEEIRQQGVHFPGG